MRVRAGCLVRGSGLPRLARDLPDKQVAAGFGSQVAEQVTLAVSVVFPWVDRMPDLLDLGRPVLPGQDVGHYGLPYAAPPPNHPAFSDAERKQPHLAPDKEIQ